MNEQLLKDLVATAQQDNYNWDVVLDKFPELSEYEPQLLKDYIATVEKEDYNYEVVNSKFPEFKFEEVESKDIEPQKEEALIEEDKDEEDVFVEMTQEELQQVKPTEGTTTDFFKEAKNTLFGGVYSLADTYDNLRKAGLEIPLYFLLNETNENASLEEKTEFRNKLTKTVKSISDAVDPQSEFLNFVKEESLKRTLPPSERTIYENLIKEGNYAEAGKQIINGTVSSVPSLIAARAGLPGLISLGISTAKGKFDENLKNPEMGLWQNLGNSLGSGTIEAVGEYFTAQMIRKAGFGKSTTKEMATKILKGGYENLFKKMGVASVKEGFSEAMTSLASNVWDAFTINKEWDWNSWLEQAFDEGVIGSVIGKSTTALGALKTNKEKEVQRAQFYLTPNDVRQEQAKTIESITKVKESIKDTENENDLKVLNNSLQELEVNLAMSQIEVNNNLRRMNEEELNIYAENIDKINSANKALNSKNPITANLAKDEITKFNAENRRLLSEASKRRVGEQVETTEDLLGLIKKGKGKVKIAKTPEEFQKLADETPEGKESKQDATQSEGFISRNGNIYVNLTKAAEVGAVNVGSHELLHAILNNTLSDAGARSRIINEFKKTLTKNELALIEDRLNRNYRYETIESIEDLTEEQAGVYKNITTLKDGTNIGELKEEFYEEEYLNSFIDLIGDKKIRPSESILNKIGEFLAPIFKGKGYKNIQFNTGKDVRKFLIDYQKGFGKKQLSEEIIKLAESGAEGKLITGEVKKSFKDRLSMSKTASDRVQNFYESRGVEAANDIINEFKPIVNKIVQRRSEAPNFDRELLTSEIELGDRGLLDLIYNYNPESGVPLAAYINKFLPARAIEASRRVLGESFTEDVSERVDIAAPEVEVEVRTKKEKVPRSLRKKLNIEKGSNIYNKVKDAVVKTFGTKLPEVTDPKFKKALSDSYKRELKKEVNSLMGTRSDFKMFVTNNAETLYKSIPQETINKRFQAFSEPVLDKEGKQVREKTAVGKGIFKKKPFNKEEFINYFLGEDVGASTKGTRKTALSETIADEMALDATLEVLEDPKVFEKFKEIQEIEGKKVPKDIKPKISEKVKRPEGFKFSKTEDFKKITEDLSDDKVEEVSRLLEDVDSNVGLSSDSQILKDQVKEVVDTAYPEKLTGKAKIVNELVKYLKPFTRQIAKFKDIKINIENYIKSLVSDNVINNYGKAFGIKNLTEVFRTKNKEQRAFLRLNTKEMLKLKDEAGNLIYKNPLDLAAESWQYKAMMEDGSANPSRAMTFYSEGKGGHVKVFIDEFISPVFSSESNPITNVRSVVGGTKSNPVDQVEFTYKNGDKKLVDSPRRAKQEVTQDMIDNKVSKKELDKREFDANRAFNFVVNQYKAAKVLLDKKLATNENMAMLAAGMGANMKGPIRAAAMLRYLPVNSKYKSLRKPTGGKAFEYEHGIPAVIVNLAIADAVLNPKSEVDLKKLQESYTVGIIDVDFNDNFGRFFKSRMPFTYKIGDLPITRWYNEFTTGGDVHALYDLKENKIVGKEEAKLWQEIQKAKASNVQTLSNNVISFSKTNNNQDIIGYAKTVDEALKIARDPNAPIKKIRVFDFDDTLAKSKSLVFYNKENDSGKPVPNNKAIFMIGGPGSGKSNIGKGLQLGREGWKVVNQDIFIESEKAKQGLPEIEKDYTKEQKSQRSKIGYAGRKAAEAKMDKYTKAGNGMVIDGTGASYNATMKKVNKLKEQGYEVFMVHAKTSNEVALERNRARKERSLPDFIVEKTQESVNNNISQYKNDLGDNFIEIDTETIEYGKPLPKEFVNDAKARFYATERGKLNAEEFAQQGAGLIEEGFAMDFSDFNIVREGEKGPLFDVAKKIEKARGTDDVFVLTARAPESQQAIHEFLKSEGLDIPIKNITGLGNSTGAAKANWLVNKAAEGYNDFYFADDAYQNVKAVKDAMSVLDVKSKVQQAKVKFSKSVNQDFNKIIEQTTGIASEKIYSEAKAKVRGANKGNKKFFIPYSAEDFMGLIYPLLSKGKLGDSQMAWFKKNLLDPYAMANENIAADRIQLMEDFKALKKALEVPKDLRKKTDSGFTKEQAVRVYLFNKAGFDVPGISKTDLNELLDLVNSDGVLKAFGDQIFNITKGDSYAKPGENWLVGTITTDLIDVLNTVKRTKYLEQSGYTANAELIFSKENLNKLEAAYGAKYREAIENVLGRMKSGKNRIFSGNRLSNRVLDYINNSTGAIMFFNTRSAVLQTISAINFLNWSFNNPIKAGAAFADQPQYWKDFVELINSDYLVDRRNGLKLNINESEIADAAATSKNKAKAAINYILQKGFLPTQFADSFAIAAGGATFYRNRIKDLVENQDMTEADAKKQAMLEWRETAEVSQQSSDPSKISAQQASDLGRVILAFANTPMQYARIQKRALQDIVNGRGDTKTNVSKIIYYAVVQNLIFNALQSALFGLGFGDDEDDEKKEKMYTRIANGMLDSQLRGLGLAGATVAVIKNFLTDIYERSGRKRPEYVDSIYKLLQISPPVSSKISKIRGAAWQFDSKKRREEIFEKGFSIDNPAYEAGAKVISATVNVPLDRVYSKVDNISGAMDEDAETWQTVAMLAGWPKWQIMPKDKKQEQSKFKNGNVEIITFETSVKDTKKEVKKLNKTKPKRKKVKLKFK